MRKRPPTDDDGNDRSEAPFRDSDVEKKKPRQKRESEIIGPGDAATATEAKAPVNPRSITVHASAWCHQCGTVWPDKAIVCPGCGGMDRSKGRTRPRLAPRLFKQHFNAPWDQIPWPRGGAACIFGRPGSGKSTLAGILEPALWMTKEQDPAPVGEMFRRLTPGFCPEVVSVHDYKDVQRELSLTEKGPAVLDSATAMGPRDALIVAHLMVAWSRRTGERSLTILQVNKAGDAAGYQEITHLFDAVIESDPNEWGLRVFNVEKSRWCNLHSRYWKFDEEGRVVRPVFDAAYSVEGGPGSYYLHPFPVGARGTWTGLLKMLAEDGKLRPGVASAAAFAKYMLHGFIQPYDVEERKRFAVDHGLTWLDPAEEYPNGFQSDPEEDDDDPPRPRKKAKKKKAVDEDEPEEA